jgi:hypothetical protein
LDQQIRIGGLRCKIKISDREGLGHISADCREVSFAQKICVDVGTAPPAILEAGASG